MKCLTHTLLLLVICNNAFAQSSSNNFTQHQEDILQQQLQLLQQQLQLLQQENRQGQSNVLTSFNIVLPKPIIADFEYVPTVQGYRFGYQLLDGSSRVENGYITGLRMDEYSRLDSKTTDFTAVGVGGRPKINLKNRKLSPSSLKGLTG